jgi:hypothetical protein
MVAKKSNIMPLKKEYLDTCSNVSKLSELVGLSVKGLERMFDRDCKLFCHRMELLDGRLVRCGDSYRYTIMTLLGLTKLRAATGEDPFDIDALSSMLLEASGTIKNAGDVGLLLWLYALAHPNKTAEVIEKFDLSGLLDRFDDGRKRKTTELSWLLTGLSYAKLTTTAQLPFVEQLAREVYRHIKRNYGGLGIFRHEIDNSLIGKIRGRIGAFSDQVYPIYALAVYSKAFEDDEALKIAKASADAICKLQGELGQWWWYYNADSGEVAGHYPVYSVHQDGMAPMALFAVQQITDSDYSKYIEKGLAWIYGENELKSNMISQEHSLIWRRIGMGKYRRIIDLLRAVLGMDPEVDKNKLYVLCHSRSYHLGWLLYSFADKI